MWPQIFSIEKKHELLLGEKEPHLNAHERIESKEGKSSLHRLIKRILRITHFISYIIFFLSVLVFLFKITPILIHILNGNKFNATLEFASVPVDTLNGRSFEREFDDFVKKYNRKYSTLEEREYRLSVFIKNVIEFENEEKILKNGVDLDITQFADWTDLEMRQILSRSYTERIPFEGSTIESSVLEEGERRAPSVDWRNSKKVTPVKDQKSCGSCWSFAVVSSVESAHAIKTGELVPMSEQELVDCDHRNNGCHGGYRPYAFDFVKTKGLVEESVYPYVGTEGNQCALGKTMKRFTIEDYKMLTTNEEIVADWVFKNGPVTFGMNVTKPMYSYRSGVFSPTVEQCTMNSMGSHALTIVGYGTTNNVDFWLVKNSWGGLWGQNGFFKLARGVNACGMANTIVAPVFH